MKRIAMSVLFLGALAFGMMGCGQKTQVQETKTVKTPGGTTETTTTVEQTKTGDHAPPANP